MRNEPQKGERNVCTIDALLVRVAHNIFSQIIKRACFHVAYVSLVPAINRESCRIFLPRIVKRDSRSFFAQASSIKY